MSVLDKDGRTVDENRTSGVRLITLKEAAKALGVTPRWLREHRSTLPFYRTLTERTHRIDEAGMIAWLARTRPRDP